MMNLPVSYLLLRSGMFPEIVFVVAIIISQCCLAARLWMLHSMIGLRVGLYMRRVYANVLVVGVISSILPILQGFTCNESLMNFILSSILSFVCTGLVVYFIGCNNIERQFVITKVSGIKAKFKWKGYTTLIYWNSFAQSWLYSCICILRIRGTYFHLLDAPYLVFLLCLATSYSIQTNKSSNPI